MEIVVRISFKVYNNNRIIFKENNSRETYLETNTINKITKIYNRQIIILIL
jgi:hypothetical protein